MPFTKMQIQAIADEKANENQLVFYVVYNRPSDYPNEFVCRRHIFLIPNRVIQPEDTLFARGRNLAEIHHQLPNGLFNLGRENSDDPKICEVWL